MKALTKIRKWFMTYAEGGLSLNEFTAFLGIRGNVGALAELIRAEDRRPQSADLPGVQSLRWVLMQPSIDNHDPEEARAKAPYALVLSFVFDGDLDDALKDLAAVPSTRRILAFCPGFAGQQIVSFLKKRRVKSGFMFRDLGPVDRDEGPDDVVYGLDATLAEIQEAVDVQERFEAFYEAASQQRGRPAETLRQRFRNAFRDDAFPFPLTRFERWQPHEPRTRRRMSELIRRMQLRIARDSDDAMRRRGAHTKGHGLLQGTFRVADNIPPEYAKGLFAAAGVTFQVHARPSNGNSGVQADRKNDARGLALSLRIPLGDENGFREADFLRWPSTQPGRQDFVLFSDPEFFAADIRQAVTIFSIITVGTPFERATRGLAFLGSGAIKQTRLVLRTVRRRVTHPLRPEFHSATPYTLGPDRVVKYSARLTDPGQLARLSAAMTDDDYLRVALRKSLRQPIRLEFFLHALPADLWLRDPSAVINAVEDATTDWTALGATPVRVGTIEFGVQDPTTPQATSAGERWSFNPWHALVAHRPLGSVNRGRLSIYRDSFAFRRQATAANVVALEPGPRPPGPDERDDAAE